MRVGFIGLGDQGHPMARMIARDGHDLFVWARRDASYETLGDDPHVRVGIPAELGETCELVGICVVNDDDVCQTVVESGLLASMRPDSIVAIHSTISTATLFRLAAAAAQHEVRVVDAPVSGGGQAAYERGITVMVGGDAADFARSRPVFESYGNPVRHLGPLGSGLRCKLLNNGLYYAHWLVAQQVTQTAVALDLDVSAFAEILASSSGDSFSARVYHAGWGWAAMPHAEKDVDLVEAELRAAGMPESEVRQLWRACAEYVAGRRGAPGDL